MFILIHSSFVVRYVELRWVYFFKFAIGWNGLGHSVDGLGQVGSWKMDLWTNNSAVSFCRCFCLCFSTQKNWGKLVRGGRNLVKYENTWFKFWWYYIWPTLMLARSFALFYFRLHVTVLFLLTGYLSFLPPFFGHNIPPSVVFHRSIRKPDALLIAKPRHFILCRNYQ